MKQKLIEQVGRSTRLKVLNELKRTVAGLPVRELGERLGMSYMGTKEVCLDLEKRGLLDTWRSPVKTGRPQLLYRLTSKATELFPAASNPLTLDLLQAAHTLFGATAPEKLLMLAFQKKVAEYEERMKGETLIERATRLTKLREDDGCMAELVVADPETLRIEEHHSPILDVLRQYPIVAKLEAEIFERILRTPVRREESAVSGLYLATFHLG